MNRGDKVRDKETGKEGVITAVPRADSKVLIYGVRFPDEHKWLPPSRLELLSAPKPEPVTEETTAPAPKPKPKKKSKKKV